MIRTDRKLATLVAIYVILLLLPVLFRGDVYILHILIYSLIWASVGAAWDLVFGYGGVPTLGQIGFFAIGAYVSAILSKSFGVSPWLGIIAGSLLAGVVGVIIGLPCLRLKGAYISLITFAFHLIIPTLLNQGSFLKTGGMTGLYNIPRLQIGHFTFSNVDKVPWYYVLLLISFLVFFTIYYVIRSSFGLAFTAVRDSVDFARSLGVNEYFTKLTLFCLSAVLTGVVGAFYAHYVGIISPRIMGFDSFLLVWVIMAIGGINRFPGVLIGSFIVNFIMESLRGIESYRLLVMGAIVVLAILFMPQGVMGLIDSAIDLLKARFRPERG